MARFLFDKSIIAGIGAIHRTAEGQLWYVSKQPDGSVSKSQVRIDATTGEIAVIEDYAKSANGEDGATKDCPKGRLLHSTSGSHHSRL
jgi:hypothetical protein